MECKKEKNLNDCPCTATNRERKGICCECIKYHRKNNELPACYFSKKTEKSFDRSIKRFIEDNK
jgi:hypothetical protein